MPEELMMIDGTLGRFRAIDSSVERTSRSPGRSMKLGTSRSGRSSSASVSYTHLDVYKRQAGVMFTANPANGRTEETVITAAWGLGEAVVAGLVDPDTIVVDTSTGRITEQVVSDKALRVDPSEDGDRTRTRPVPDVYKRQLGDRPHPHAPAVASVGGDQRQNDWDRRELGPGGNAPVVGDQFGDPVRGQSRIDRRARQRQRPGGCLLYTSRCV